MEKEAIGIWMAKIALVMAVAAVIGFYFVTWGWPPWHTGLQGQMQRLQGQMQKLRETNERIKQTVLAREPKVEVLEPFVQPEGKLSWVVVPIKSSSMLPSVIPHRIRVAVTFKNNNPIQKIDSDSFRVIDGGEGNHKVTLERSRMGPGWVVYLSFLVLKGELPEEVTIDWAEKTERLGLEKILGK